jgi:hypothetical protein
VIAISEFTKREVVELLGVEADRVSVIPNGIEAAFKSGRRGPPARRRDLSARTRARGELRDARRLRVVGAGWGESISGLALRFDDEVASRRAALCTRPVRASAPVAEAMACGTPVVTSRGGATEETAGGAAVLVDPLDVDDIARGITDAIGRGDELRRLGLERARAFSWEAAAQATLWRSTRRRRDGVGSHRRGRDGASAPGDDVRPQPARHLPGATTGELRFAALTRHPELVPAGSSRYTSRGSQELRMAWSTARVLRDWRSPTPARSAAALPCPAVVTSTTSFERDSTAMGRVDRRVFRPSCRARPRRRARAFAVGADEGGHRRAVRRRA